LDEQITNGVKVFMLTSSYNPADYNTSFTSKHVCQYIHKPLNLKTLKEL
jgi:response regulator RpfG family c-di-GMP phosphodiesterase